MANHLNFTQVTALLSQTIGASKPGDIDDIMDALRRINAMRSSDGNRATESTLSTLFASRAG